MKYVLTQIPLSGGAQSFRLLIKEVTYLFRVVYANVPEGGWVLDLSTDEGVPIVCGVPLVTGINILGQYGYLSVGAVLIVHTVDPMVSSPDYAAFDSTAGLYLVSEA